MRTAGRSRVETVVISTQHAPDVDHATRSTRDMIEHVVTPAYCPPSCSTRAPSYFINPTGRFVIGGPQGDSGLTGRKIIVDTYGGYAPPRRRRVLRQGSDQGGPLRRLRGPPRGEEPGRGRPGASSCEIGWPMPSAWPSRSPSRWTPSAPARWTTRRLAQLVERGVRPAPRRHHRRAWTCAVPSTRRPPAYGHFGRLDLDLPWEKTDYVDRVRAAAEKLR